MHKRREEPSQKRPATLKTVAKHVGLSIATVSQVLNHSPKARSIPQFTKDRIFAAALKLSYRPNPIAQALRSGSSDPAKAACVLMLGNREQLRRVVLAIREAGFLIPDDIVVVRNVQF